MNDRVSPFGECSACDSTACVCNYCGRSEEDHFEAMEALYDEEHEFDPTDCEDCTKREPTADRRQGTGDRERTGTEDG